MFRQWKGQRAFDRCDVKVLEFKDFVFEVTGQVEEDDDEESEENMQSVLSTNPAKIPGLLPETELYYTVQERKTIG